MNGALPPPYRRFLSGSKGRGEGQLPAALIRRFLMAYAPLKLRFFEPLDDRH
jgi:hypothetical protein